MWFYVKILASLPFPLPFGFLPHSTKNFWPNIDLPCCANFGKSTLATLYKRRGKSKSHVILHAFRNCWKILWIDSPNAFVNDISSKKIKRYYSGLLRIQFLCWQDFKYYVACSLWKYLVFAITYLHEIYFPWTFKPSSLPSSRKNGLFSGVKLRYIILKLPWWGVIYVTIFVTNYSTLNCHFKCD